MTCNVTMTTPRYHHEIVQEEEEEDLATSRRGKRKHLPSYVEEAEELTSPQFSFCDVAPLVMNGISTIRDDQV